MKALEINDILESDEWFMGANQEEVMDTLTSQPILSGLVQVIIEEDLEEADEYVKDMFYSLFGTILRAYKVSLEDSFAEVSEDDVKAAFEKHNKFSELLSKSLGFSDVPNGEDEEEQAAAMMEKLANLEAKFNAEEDFDLEKEGMGELVELIKQVNENSKQPAINAYLQAELEEADIDDQFAGFINQQFVIIVDSIENMIERTNKDPKMKIV